MISSVKYQNKSSHVIPKAMYAYRLTQNKFSSVLLSTALVQCFHFRSRRGDFGKHFIKTESKLRVISIYIYMQDLSLAIQIMRINRIAFR